MAKLLDDTLLFASHSILPLNEVCDARRELQEVVAQRRALGEAVELSEASAGFPASVRCSQMSVRRMVNNLTDNALRYGTCARLSLSSDEHGVEIIVEDDGPGVPVSSLATLAQPFVRLETSRGRETGGAGLGLAIVKGLVESCQGSLTLANGVEGGLRATLRFAAATAPDLAINLEP